MTSIFFEEVIGIHRSDIVSCSRRARFLLIGGTSILLLAAVSWIMAFNGRLDGNLAPSLVSVLGTFVSICALLPYKEITPRRLALARCVHLKEEYERIKDWPEEKRERRLSEINKYLSEVVVI